MDNKKRMKIVDRQISELIPADYNPRVLKKKQFEDIKKSLEKFGFVDPVIVNTHPDRENIIVGGHQRVKVWQSLGHDTVPTVEVFLSITAEKELNVRLNKNTGEWDFDILANEFDASDLLDWGFEKFELGGIELDPEEEWKGMPEFESEDQTGCKQVVVHFKTMEDYANFCILINQTLSDKTKSIWYPEVERGSQTDHAYTAENE